MKTVLITGASSGIGKETAILFAAKGWKVAATMRNPKNLGIFASNEHISTYLMDVTSHQSVSDCIARAIADAGSIQAVVNNAGIYTTAPLEFTEEEKIADLINTNLLGLMDVTRLMIKHFREQGSGSIINISSIAGLTAFPFQSIYHASKWAIEGFSESLRYELDPLNIKVRLIEPGMVRTNIYNNVLTPPQHSYPGEYASHFSRWHSYLIGNYQKGYMPDCDARTIYRAVTDKGSKLRFTSDSTTRFAVTLHKILPYRIFKSFVKALI